MAANVKNLNFAMYDKIDVYDLTDDLIGRSDVQGGDKKGNIYISSPISENGLRVLEVGQKVSCISYHNHKAYRFTTKVSDRFVENIKIFVLQKPERFETFQRRESVRVDHILPVLYAVITEEEKDYIINENVPKEIVRTEFAAMLQQARTYNLSAGGLGIYTLTQAVQINDYIVVFLNFDGREEMMITQVVKVSMDDFKGGKDTSRKTGVKLIHGSKGVDERMFRYLFTLMREQSIVKSQE